MRPLHDGPAAVPDFRRAQGRKHSIACALTVHVLAGPASMKGCLAAGRFAKALSQEGLEAVGACRNPETGLREPVSRPTLHRVVQQTGPEALEDAPARRPRPRIHPAEALAADGRRIRGASRNGDGHHGTVALVDHESGAPFALLNFDGGGGETAQDLLERSDVRGRAIAFDAPRTTRRTAKPVTETCGADRLLTVRGNAPETFATPGGIDWERDAAGSFAEDAGKAHGRTGQRSVSVLTPPGGLVNHPGVSRTARVTRCREPLRKRPDDAGKDWTGTACPHRPARRGGRVAGGSASPEPRTSGSAEHEPPPERPRLRRGRLPDPHRQRPGEPGQPQQHGARGGLRQPPRGGEPRADPAAAAAGPQPGRRRPDPAMGAAGVRGGSRTPPESRSFPETDHPDAGNGARAALRALPQEGHFIARAQ